MGDANWRSELLELVEAQLRERRRWAARSAAVALIYSPVVGISFAAGWLLICAALSLAPAHQIVARAKADKAWTFFALLHIGSLTAAVACLGVMAGWHGRLWGVLSGELLVASMVFTVATKSGTSRMAFYAAVIPLGAALLALPMIAARLEPSSFGPSLLVALALAIIVVATVDQSRVRRSILEIKEARAQAEAATAAKSAFVAMVSHELRTPLSGILAGALEMETAAGDRGARARAGLVIESARMMKALLDDLLDLAKLNAGKMAVENIEFDLRAMLASTLVFWRPQARAHGLKLRVLGTKAVPSLVRGDPNRLRQILNNLISNALKFTTHGSITVQVATDADHEDGILIRVIDTGVGMEASEVDRLFQAFEQLSDSTARKHGGTGLGLNISRELARAMGGDLSATSAKGEGSTFTLRVPLPLSDCLFGEGAADEIEADADLHLNVLVVDDHVVNRQALTLILTGLGCSVATAIDGEDALLQLASSAFDLVLMDVNMPRVDGHEATRRLRASGALNSTTPIVALTGSVGEADVIACFEAGMNAFAAKPVEPSQLLGAMQTALRSNPTVGSQRLPMSAVS